MKRDLDLIRYLLLKIEDSSKDSLYVSDFVTDTYDDRNISHHIKLLLDEDFIEATAIPIMCQEFDDFEIKRITMQGYDYLDSVRDETVWAETKNRITSKVASASLEIVKAVAASVTTKMLGI